MEALREIVYSAIAHKNYKGPAIQMHVYDDRIEIWNDGGLPEGYTADTLYGNHPSRPRNPKIAGAMFKAGFIDTWGRGYNYTQASRIKDCQYPLWQNILVVSK